MLVSHFGKKLGMKSKQKCAVFANCQADLIKTCLGLSKEFVEQYELVKIPLNFRAIEQKFTFSDELLTSFDVFIYQPLQDKHGELSTNRLLTRLSDRCVRIGVPFVYFKGYYPQHVSNPLAKPSPRYPYGQFPYGDQFIIDMIEAGKTDAEIIRTLTRTDLYEKEFLLDEVEQSLEKLAQRESQLDVKISDFIRQNYQHARLFDTLNHPTEMIGLELTNQIFQILGLSRLPHTTLDLYHTKAAPLIATGIQTINWMLRRTHLKPFANFYQAFLTGHQVPIYPSVINHLNLTFLTAHSTYTVNGYRKKLTFEEYIAAYLTQYSR